MGTWEHEGQLNVHYKSKLKSCRETDFNCPKRLEALAVARLGTDLEVGVSMFREPAHASPN